MSDLPNILFIVEGERLEPEVLVRMAGAVQPIGMHERLQAQLDEKIAPGRSRYMMIFLLFQFSLRF